MQHPRLPHARLQRRIVLLFSLVAILPTLLVASFAALFFNLGVQNWFNDQVSTALKNSVLVAEGYLAEHKKIIRADALAMANDLSRSADELIRSPSLFNNVVNSQAALRSLTEAVVFQRRNVLARSSLSFSLLFNLADLSSDALEKADSGEVVILTNDTGVDDRVRALIKLNNFYDTYLLVGRPVDGEILGYVASTRGSVYEYQKLKTNIVHLQNQFMLLFIAIAVILLVAAIWFGVGFARGIAYPIEQLVEATEEVKSGRLEARVPERRRKDEITMLQRAFNRMAEQLERQRGALLVAERTAAWAEVARRIAHEIKNPLTPIQLSAERIKAKYRPKNEADQEVFDKYLDTIIRHVGDMGRMVDEFAEFSRLPTPVFASVDLAKIIRESVFSREQINPSITFELHIPKQKCWIRADSRHISRAFDNILKNAMEAMENTKSGKINVTLEKAESSLTLTILDNGPGFPPDLIDRLTEPYVTTRKKGTGLGLAIVKKIIDDHNATLEIFNQINASGEIEGACIHIKFPVEAHI